MEENAVLFIWVAWSIQAMHSERVMREVTAAIQPVAPIVFFRADLTDGEGEAWNAIREWLDQGDDDRLTHAGCGSLVLARRGHVIGSMLYAGDSSPSVVTDFLFKKFGISK